MTKTKWLAYNDLAWTDLIVSSPEESKDETEFLVKLIKDNSRIEVKTLLHLGCGTGFYDDTFKRHFRVTGVDISEGSLEIARKQNPEVTYVHGDMRNYALDESFDAVTIPDSIGYLTTESELRDTIQTANRHLKPGGMLLIVALVREDFQNNNFVYSGSKGDTEVTIFENNYASETDRATYEATLVYLIRRKGELEVVTERHTLGLFPLSVLPSLLMDAGFEVKEIVLEHSYDRFILEDGEYPLRIFACRKPLL